ncbi:hypothetical protein [Helcococcus ovis]
MSGKYTDRRKTYNKSYNSNSSEEKTKESSNNSFEERYIREFN